MANFNPTVESLMAGQASTHLALSILRERLQNSQEAPYFMGINADDPNTSYQVDLKAFEHTGSYIELGFVYRHDRSQEFTAALIGTTVCGEDVSDGVDEEVKVRKEGTLHEGVFREFYTLKLPSTASQTMRRVFEGQTEAIAAMIATVAAKTQTPPLAVDNNAIDARIDAAVNIKVMGPPTCKIGEVKELETVDFANSSLTLGDYDPTFPQDQLFDVWQERVQNWRGHLLFSEESTSLLTGRFRFWLTSGFNVECRFLADSIREIAGQGRRL